MYGIKKKMDPTEQLQQLQKAEASQHTQSSSSDIIYSLIFTVTSRCLCWKETPQHFTLASGTLSTESRPQSQQSAENRFHRTRSIASSVLSASPVTLPALSLYPQASSITYQASRSDVTAPAHTPTTPQTPVHKSCDAKHTGSRCCAQHGRPSLSLSAFRHQNILGLWISSRETAGDTLMAVWELSVRF